jgi:ribosomal protein L16 Arg81 hydroxylase
VHAYRLQLIGANRSRTRNGEEVFEAGDAFYAPPGHVPVKHAPGTEAVFFSPSDELQKTEEVMAKNMQAMQGG